MASDVDMKAAKARSRQAVEEAQAVPVDAAALRRGLAGMRDALAEVQLELEETRRQLEEAERREADLEVALAESEPSAQRLPSIDRRRRWLRSARLFLLRGTVRVVPRALLPFVWHNPLFDAGWYLERYPDVRAQHTDPERHFRRHGVAEDRDPNPLFDTSWYLDRYPDVSASGINPLDHYHLHGTFEGRDPSTWFHTRWYLSQNPDVAATGMDPLLHYLRYGLSEGRAIRPGGRAGQTSLSASCRSAAALADRRSRPGRPREHGRLAGLTGHLDGVPLDRPIVLMLDDAIPRPDHDAGSMLIEQYVRLFGDLGYHVYFVALRDDGLAPQDRQALSASGVTVVDVRASQVDVLDLLAVDGPRIDVAFLSRVTVAAPYVEEVRNHCPKARIIFNTQDLHFLREERAARLTGDRVGMFRAAALQAEEVHVVRMSDATIVVSRAEQELLEDLAPGAAVYWCPLIHDVVGRSNGFSDRSGIAFLGGYRHLPNLDAVRYFLDEVWPLIRRALPAASFYAIGADMPEEIRERGDEGFVAVGHVPDLTPWLERVRLTVAPLRYGAGMKGKVLSSLACGVPCVVTPIAAEGMVSADGGTVLAEDAQAFAEATVRLHEDEAAWEVMSQAGLRWIDANVSVARGRERLRDLLAGLGAPLPPDVISRSREAEASSTVE